MNYFRSEKVTFIFAFQLAAKVSSLQDELGNMRLEETLGAALVKNLEDPHGSANAKLLAHLDQVRIGIARN